MDAHCLRLFVFFVAQSYGITLRKDEYMFTEHNMSESEIRPEVSVLSGNASKT